MTKFLDLIRDLIFAIIFQLAPRLANVVLFILLGRLIGADEAGVFTLATTYLLIMSAIMFGLDDLLTRQVAQEPSAAFNYLTNFTLLRFGLTIIIYLLFLGTVTYLFDYSGETTGVILIMGLSMIPDSLSYVAQSVLLGQRFFLGPTIIITIASIIKLLVGVQIIQAEGSLIQIARVWLYASLISMLSMWALTLVRTRRPAHTSLFDTSLITRHWRTASVFIFITALATFETQFDTVILSGYHGESAVAWFGAATTVAYGLILIAHAYRYASYPLFSRYAVESQEKLARLYENSLLLLSFVVFPLAASVAILASEIVTLIFGSNFTQTIPVLQILVFALLFIFLNEPNIRMLLVHERQKQLALFLLAAAVVNVALNLLLAKFLGAEGSAISRIVSSLLFFTLTYFYVKEKIVEVRIFHIIAKPTAAAIIMSILLLLILDWPLPLVIILGILIYLVALRLLGGWPTFPWEDLQSAAGRSAESPHETMTTIHGSE